jgi:hypothetical protein
MRENLNEKLFFCTFFYTKSRWEMREFFDMSLQNTIIISAHQLIINFQFSIVNYSNHAPFTTSPSTST